MSELDKSERVYYWVIASVFPLICVVNVTCSIAFFLVAQKAASSWLIKHCLFNRLFSSVRDIKQDVLLVVLSARTHTTVYKTNK